MSRPLDPSLSSVRWVQCHLLNFLGLWVQPVEIDTDQEKWALDSSCFSPLGWLGRTYVSQRQGKWKWRKVVGSAAFVSEQAVRLSGSWEKPCYTNCHFSQCILYRGSLSTVQSWVTGQSGSFSHAQQSLNHTKHKQGIQRSFLLGMHDC